MKLFAIDSVDFQYARACIRKNSNVKIGLEFYTAHGYMGVRDLRYLIDTLFLDLKLHDIPRTVGAAVKSVMDLRPTFLSIHASGGTEMITAACGAVENSETKIIAVTVLTSLKSRLDQVYKLAHIAFEAGAHGVVCSAYEAALIRKAFGEDFIIIVPGIRRAGSNPKGQKRFATAEQALKAGADYIIVSENT